MLKALMLIALLLNAACTLGHIGNANPSVTVTPSGSPSNSAPFGLTLDPNLSDEFNGTSLDTTKWRASGAGGCTNCVNDGSLVTVSGGQAHISETPSSSNGDGLNHVSGVLSIPNTGMPPEPSYFESRVQIGNTGAANTTVELLAGAPPGQNQIEEDAMDTVGGQGPGGAEFMYTPNFSSQIGSATCPTIGGVPSGFHTYGIRRVSGQLQVYFDGAQICAINNIDPIFATQLTSLAINIECEFANCNGPATTDIDYMRVFH